MKLLAINSCKTKTFLCIPILFFLIATSAFAQLIELPFEQKMQKASTIFEGKIIGKTSFWNPEHTLIFTSNKVEVYKVFKGDITSLEVDVIAEGGKVENEIQDAESNLHFKEGFIGVFIAESSPVNDPQNLENKTPSLQLYGGSQGFIKYDLLNKTASDPFKKYNNIENDVYKAIQNQTGQPFRVIKTNTVDQSLNDKNGKKRRFWKRRCKKK